MKIYSIYDSKADNYGPLMLAVNENTIQREIIERLGNTPYAQFKEDFTLFELGAWDDVTGTITPYAAQRSICSLVKLFGLPDDSDTDTATVHAVQ